MIEEYEHFNWEVFHLNSEKSNFFPQFYCGSSIGEQPTQGLGDFIVEL